MQYRTWDKIGEKVSLLGTGTMRLPLTDSGEIDEPTAIESASPLHRRRRQLC